MIISLAMETTGLTDTGRIQEILELAIVNENKEVLFLERFKPYSRTQWKAATEKNGIHPRDLRNCLPLADYRDEITEIIGQSSKIIVYNSDFIHWFLRDSKLLPNKSITYVDLEVPFRDIYKETRGNNNNYVFQTLLTCVQYYGFLTVGFKNSTEKGQGLMHVYQKMKEEAVFETAKYTGIITHDYISPKGNEVQARQNEYIEQDYVQSSSGSYGVFLIILLIVLVSIILIFR